MPDNPNSVDIYKSFDIVITNSETDQIMDKVKEQYEPVSDDKFEIILTDISLNQKDKKSSADNFTVNLSALDFLSF